MNGLCDNDNEIATRSRMVDGKIEEICDICYLRYIMGKPNSDNKGLEIESLVPATDDSSSDCADSGDCGSE